MFQMPPNAAKTSLPCSRIASGNGPITFHTVGAVGATGKLLENGALLLAIMEESGLLVFEITLSGTRDDVVEIAKSLARINKSNNVHQTICEIRSPILSWKEDRQETMFRIQIVCN
eukprot:GEZU01013159.1.p2 GENE.GEZU01013159.1~~GEZU01013159.1.p2  ORF type:complete len:116 (-),score=1.40 GEZU01013159.1:21-368(-)